MAGIYSGDSELSLGATVTRGARTKLVGESKLRLEPVLVKGDAAKRTESTETQKNRSESNVEE